MVPEIITGLGVLNSTLDLVKGLKNISDTAIRNAAIIELQEKILSAYSAHAALVQHVGELEAKMAQMETWDAEKQRYALAEYGGGTFAYALKPEETRGEPPHRICANCYQQGRKSILQTKEQRNGQDIVHCQSCDKTYGLGQKVLAPLPNRAVTKDPNLWMR